MSTLLFLFLHALKRLSHKNSNAFYQFYNIEYLKWKGTKIGENCSLNSKIAFSISPNARLEIGEDFICRSGFQRHILGGEYSSVNIFKSGGVKIGRHSGMSATNIKLL